MLHDISGIIPNSDRVEYCSNHSLDLIEIEKALPVLSHQYISKHLAYNYFNIEDEVILSAIACHTTLKPNPSPLDLLLFIVDKLEWDQDGQAPYKRLVEQALDSSLEDGVLAYMTYMLENDLLQIVHPKFQNTYESLQERIRIKAWLKVTQFDENLYIIQEHKHWEKTNIYFFIGEQYNILFDSGTGVYPIKPLLDTIDCKPVEVITSHVHWDHIGNHKSFETIYVHEKESNWLKHGIPIPEAYIISQLKKDVDEYDIKNNKYIDDYKVYSSDDFRILEDGDVFDLGNRILKVLHTPGHSPGHLMLYDEENEILLTGDVCYKACVFCNYDSTDPLDLLDSY